MGIERVAPFPMFLLTAGFLMPGFLPAQEPAEPADRPIIAIMDFTNSALLDHATYEPFSVGIVGMLMAELARSPRIELVERERIRQVLEEVDLGASGHADPETAARAGRILGARYMIFGGFVIDPRGNLRIDARAVQVETSRVVRVETVTDDADNLIRAVQRLGRQLSEALDLPGVGIVPEQAPAPRDQVLANLKYARALLEEDRRNPDRAVELYREFLAESPPGYAVALRQHAEERIRILTGG